MTNAEILQVYCAEAGESYRMLACGQFGEAVANLAGTATGSVAMACMESPTDGLVLDGKVTDGDQLRKRRACLAAALVQIALELERLAAAMAGVREDELPAAREGNCPICHGRGTVAGE